MGAEVVATTPELWETFVEICMSLGVDMTQLPALTTPQEIIEFCHTLNIQLQPLYKEVTTLEQSGWTWVVNTPANPAETTDMVVRGVTDLVVTGGGATSISRGKNLFGTVSRRVAAGAMIAALGVSTFFAQIGEYIDNLVEGLTPWTTDGVDAVPVMIDENGTTYFDQRAIDTFRRGLANLGIFDVGPTTGVVDDTTKLWQPTSYLQPIKFITGVTEITVPMSYNNYTVNAERYVFATPQTVVIFVPKNTSSLDNYTGNVYVYAFSTVQATQVDVYDDQYNRQTGQWTIDTTPSSYALDYRNDRSGNRYYGRVITTYGNRINTYESVTGESWLNWKNYASYSDYPNGEQGRKEVTADIAYIYYYGTLSGGGGVPGFEPTNTTVGDLTKSLTDIFPDWTDNAVTIPSPKDDDLTNTSDWLPVSVTSTDPFVQDHTSTSDDQDGDTTEDVQEGILQRMMELIQSLTQTDTGNPDEVITPTIPVGDSGDTPPATPTVISGASNGLWTIYNPTLSEVQQFGGWLWSESLIDQIIRQFNNPIEAVIGFMSIYCTPITGDRKVIKAGYLSSPVSAKEVTNQYVTINCGQVEVPEYYHTAVDYTRSKVEIFLPFIGIVPLDCSVVTGSTLEVIYRIDVLTGTCLAQIKVIKQNSDAVMYTYPGNCAVQLPLTASTYTGMVGAIMGAISGGFALGMGDVGGGIKKLGEGLVSGMSNLSGTAKSGNLSSNAGALGIRIPYLIITHPTVYDAMIYNQFYGYPSNVYQRLSAMSGFVRVKDIHLDSISCTEQEREMIYNQLKEGVIIS